MQQVRKLVSKKELKTVLGIPYSFAHIARLEAAGKFPRRVKLGACRVAWIVDEVSEWIEERVAQRDRLADDTSF
jgi:prophage regulatory protein